MNGGQGLKQQPLDQTSDPVRYVHLGRKSLVGKHAFSSGKIDTIEENRPRVFALGSQ
jgi:hypothetical protein